MENIKKQENKKSVPHEKKARTSWGRRKGDGTDPLEAYRSMIEIIPVAALIIDLEGKIHLANKRIANLHGYGSQDEITGMKGTDLIVPEERAASNAEEQTLQKTDYKRVEHYLIRKDGTRFPAEVHITSLRNSAGDWCGFLVIPYDITDRKRAAEALSESEARYRNIINSIPIGLHLYQLEPDGRLLFQGANPAADRILGVENSIFIGKTIEEAFPALTKTEAPYRYRITAETGTPWNADQIDYDENSIRGAFEVNTFQIGHNRMAAAFADITERKKAEEALRENEERYRLVTEMSTDYLFKAKVNPDRTMTITYVSENLPQLTGREPGEISSSDLWNTVVHPENLEAFIAFKEKLLSTGEPDEIEFRSFLKDGTMRWVHVFVRPIRDQKTGAVTSVIGAVKDITERKKHEERIKASLAEKETLLREIHHRVKNNLQIITSLLGLQARYQNNDELLRQFEEAQHRIRSMALVHEKLYRSEDFSHIDFKSYIVHLADEVMAGYSVTVPIRMRMDIEDVHVSIDQAVPCGLILTELLTNAIKYAFPEGWKGAPEITISFHRKEDGVAELIISDNGIGVPEGIAMGKTESLGFSLVPMLAQQLHGEARLDHANGSTFTIVFSLSNGVMD